MYDRLLSARCSKPSISDIAETFLRTVCSASCLFLLLLLIVPIRSQTVSVDEGTRVHFGDIVDVDVVGSLEYDWRGKLNAEGYLDGMNAYGEPIRGLCLSESELEQAIAKALSNTLRDPKIVVRIVDRSNRAAVTLDGAVRLPQRFQLRRPARLQELLVLSGGLSDDASGEIQIFRPTELNCFGHEGPGNDGSVMDKDPVDQHNSPVSTVKISALLAGDTQANPEIRSGDLITVLRASPVYVIGGVNDPRPILSAAGLTLSRAIASAGGIAKEGSKSGVTIFRTQAGRVSVIEADIAKIESKAADDPVVLPLDIIEVPQINKPRSKLAPVVESNRTARPAVLPLRIVE